MQISRKKKIWLISICLMAGIFFLLVVGSNVLLENKIKNELKHLPPEIIISFSSIKANIFTSAISFANLHIQFHPYKQLPNHHELYTSQLLVNGIALLKLLSRKTISIDHIQLGKTEIKLDSFLLAKRDSAQAALFASLKVPFYKTDIRHFDLHEMSVWIQSSDTTQLLTRGTLMLDGITIDNAQHFQFTNISCNLASLNYSLSNYGFLLHTGRVQINSKMKSLFIDSIRVTMLSNQAKGNFYQIHAFAHELKMTELDVKSLVEQKVKAEEVLVNESKIYVGERSNKANKSLKFTPLHNTKFPFEIDVKHFNINHTRLNYNNELKAKGSFTLNDLHGKGMSNTITRDSVHFSSVHSSFRDITFYAGRPARIIHIGLFVMDSKKAILQAENITVNSVYTKFQLARKLGYQADWLSASVKRIRVTKLDIKQLLHNSLNADKLLVYGAYVYVYRDRRLPRRLIHQLMPKDFLKQIQAKIRIHTLVADNVTVDYEEMPKEGLKSGILSVKDIYATVSPLVNPVVKTDPDYIHFYTKASLMGSGSIHATIDMPLRKSIYYVQGAIKNLDLAALNSSAENLGRFHIRSGMLNNLAFHFQFDEIKSTGNIVGEYHNLIVEKLKKNRKKAWFPSLVLRHIIIPVNKDKSLPVQKRTGQIDYTRDDTRFISYFLLKSLLTGIRSSFAFGFLLPK